jgi:hypothetical protein
MMQQQSRRSQIKRNSGSSSGCNNKTDAAEANAANDASTKADSAESNAIVAAAADATTNRCSQKQMHNSSSMMQLKR